MHFLAGFCLYITFVQQSLKIDRTFKLDVPTIEITSSQFANFLKFIMNSFVQKYLCWVFMTLSYIAIDMFLS